MFQKEKCFELHSVRGSPSNTVGVPKNKCDRLVEGSRRIHFQRMQRKFPPVVRTRFWPPHIWISPNMGIPPCFGRKPPYSFPVYEGISPRRANAILTALYRDIALFGDTALMGNPCSTHAMGLIVHVRRVGCNSLWCSGERSVELLRRGNPRKKSMVLPLLWLCGGC